MSAKTGSYVLAWKRKNAGPGYTTAGLLSLKQSSKQALNGTFSDHHGAILQAFFKANEYINFFYFMLKLLN